MRKERSIYRMQAVKPRGINPRIKDMYGRRKSDERREGEMPVAQPMAGAGERNWDLKRAYH